MNDLRALGASAEANKKSYQHDEVDASLLEAFESPFAQRVGQQSMWEHIIAPEFTSLCPITGQPDFAKIHVLYQPHLKCVESKSFKLYLGSFRNVGAFHERVAAMISRDLVVLLDPIWLFVWTEFTPRGGIAFQPRVEYGPVPLNVRSIGLP